MPSPPTRNLMAYCRGGLDARRLLCAERCGKKCDYQQQEAAEALAESSGVRDFGIHVVLCNFYVAQAFTPGITGPQILVFLAPSGAAAIARP